MANKRPNYKTKLEIILEKEGITCYSLRNKIVEFMDEVNKKYKLTLNAPSLDTIYNTVTGKRVNRMLITYKRILLGINNMTNKEYTLNDIVNLELLEDWGS